MAKTEPNRTEIDEAKTEPNRSETDEAKTEPIPSLVLPPIFNYINVYQHFEKMLANDQLMQE